MPRSRSNAVTTAPAMGAHRPRSPIIGAHRPPALQLQQQIGNQATQGMLADTAPVTENYEDTHVDSAPVSTGYDNAPEPEGPVYEDFTPEPEAGHAYDEIAPQPEGPVYEDFIPEPEAGHAYDEIAPQPEAGASGGNASPPQGGGLYGAYGQLDADALGLAPQAPQAPQAAPAPQGGGGLYDAYGHADAGELGQAPQGQQAPGFAMQPMGAGMQEFDTRPIRPNAHMHTALPSTTFYADSPEKQAPYSRSFGDDGKMTNDSDGSSVSSIGAERPAAIGAKGDRHIFAMDGQGKFHTADAIKENKDRSQAAQASGASQQERFHHSSFLAGADVAGAGEMQVRDGQVELVSDTSGHYRPGSKQMMQTVQQLEKNKVQTEKLGVEFVGKSQGQKALQASATELLGYQDHSPETAETQMRTEHGKKDNVLRELLGKSRGKADDANLKPSELNAPQPVAPVVAPQAQPPGQDRPQGAYAHYNNVYEEEAPEAQTEESVTPTASTAPTGEYMHYNNVYQDEEEAPSVQSEENPAPQAPLAPQYKYYN